MPDAAPDAPPAMPRLPASSAPAARRPAGLRAALLPVSLAVSLAGLAAGCAAPPRPNAAAAPAETAAEPPLWRLPPATLGRTLAWQQRLQATVQGRAQPPLDALLEADATRVRLALLGAGQTLARLDWDGRTLQHQLAPGWPAALSPERVLSDLQLALWPLEALAATLPPGARLEEAGGERVLWWQGERLATVRGARSLQVDLVQHRLGYRLQISSQPADPDPNPEPPR